MGLLGKYPLKSPGHSRSDPDIVHPADTQRNHLPKQPMFFCTVTSQLSPKKKIFKKLGKMPVFLHREVGRIIAGDDIKTLQENMGHYSAAFTLDRYGHVTETMHRESANRMQAFIEKMA